MPDTAKPPVGQAVVLALQHAMQRLDACVVVGAIGRQAALDDGCCAFDGGQPLLQRRSLLIGRRSRSGMIAGERQQSFVLAGCSEAFCRGHRQLN